MSDGFYFADTKSHVIKRDMLRMVDAMEICNGPWIAVDCTIFHLNYSMVESGGTSV